MKVEITARRLTVDAKAKETIGKRLEKLSKVLPREADAKVVIRLEKRGASGPGPRKPSQPTSSPPCRRPSTGSPPR